MIDIAHVQKIEISKRSVILLYDWLLPLNEESLNLIISVETNHNKKNH